MKENAKRVEEFKEIMENPRLGFEVLYAKMFDLLVFIEKQLDEVSSHPFLEKDADGVPKQTDAWKVWKDLIARYNSILSQLQQAYKVNYKDLLEYGPGDDAEETEET